MIMYYTLARKMCSGSRRIMTERVKEADEVFGRWVWDPLSGELGLEAMRRSVARSRLN